MGLVFDPVNYGGNAAIGLAPWDLLEAYVG
jgi:hypothetical protein